MSRRARFPIFFGESRRAGRTGAAALCVLLAACASAPTQTRVGLPPLPAATEIRLGAGDTLQLDFAYWPELNSTQAVRRDGMISLDQIGDVRVAGLCIADLKKELEARYDVVLKNPSINVILRSRPPQHVYVGGEVRNPGFLTLVPMTDCSAAPAYLGNSNRVVFQDRMTLSQALVAAGGFENRSANLSNVVVVRYLDGKRFAAAFDVREFPGGGEADPVYLAGNDIVYVPRTKIDKVTQWVDQYLNDIIPKRLQGIVTQSSGDGRRQISVGITP